MSTPSTPHLPTIALIGRTNVGKSSLFNRLIESRRAIVSPIANTTRDRTYGTCRWRGREIRLIDTGGADIPTLRDSIHLLERRSPQSENDPLGAGIIRQTQAAIREADVLLLVVDGKAGVLPADRDLARLLQRLTAADDRWGGPKKIFAVCNKIDRAADVERVAEFFGLGLGEPLPVSAKNGRATGELLDDVLRALPAGGETPADAPGPRAIRVGLIGKPNVGKSSLMNKISGTERAIVTPQPLTTRETQELELEHRGHTIKLFDTAGIKPWRKTVAGIETAATAQSLAALKEIDIALFTVEAQELISHQDQALAALIQQSHAGAIIVVNKWDLVAALNQPELKNIAAHYHNRLPALSFAPVRTISALTGQNVQKLLDLIVDIWERRHIEIAPDQLTDFIRYASHRHRPSGTGKGKAGEPGAERPRLTALEQVGINPPAFTLWIKPRQSLDDTYRRFLEHLLSEKFELEGTNAKLYVKQRRPAHRRPG
ncbi:MAG: ribosome biogenesis GTPase Der [Patescibacteria group bacterium]|nr:ribosome biogenesis GTPase Der [Patescibacteria group bacterium]